MFWFTFGKNLILLRVIVLWFIYLTAVHVDAQRPDFNNFDPNNTPRSTTTTDSIILKAFKYRYLDLNDLSKPRYDFDTSLQTIHLVERNYQSPFLKGGLGSENSPSYEPLWKPHNAPGIEGDNVFHEALLQHPSSNRLVDVNRPLANISYAKGFSINSADFDLGFYRKFNRKILLNIIYNSLSDDSWTGLQPNESRVLGISWMQESKMSRRLSYLKFEKGNYEEVQSRGFIDGAAESANITYGRWHIEAGNQIYLRDSILTPTSPRLITKLKYVRDDFEFRDAAVSASERNYYSYVPADDTLSRTNNFLLWSLDNHIILFKKGWKIETGLDMDILSLRQTALSEKYFQINVPIIAEKKLSLQSVFSGAFEVSLLDGKGDISLHGGINHTLDTQNELNFTLYFDLLEPLSRYQRVSANQSLLWSNDLGKYTRTALSASWSNIQLDTRLQLQYSLLGKYTVLDEAAMPIQLASPAHIIQFSADQSLALGPVKTSHHGFYQFISHDRILRPALGYSGTAVVGLPLFKNRWDMKMGVDVHYLADYSIPNYNPVLADFFNDFSNSRSGHIVLINPFLNVKIDRFFGFVKVVNAANRLNTQNHFLTVDYPIYDFRIVAGIRWDLLD